MNSFAKTLEKMRVTKNSLSSDPTKTELAKHFQGQLSTLVVSTEERLKEYREALSELDQRIRTMQLADTTQAHPPLQRQTGLQTLSHPPTPWQNCCVIL